MEHKLEAMDQFGKFATLSGTQVSMMALFRNPDFFIGLAMITMGVFFGAMIYMLFAKEPKIRYISGVSVVVLFFSVLATIYFQANVFFVTAFASAVTSYPQIIPTLRDKVLRKETS